MRKGMFSISDQCRKEMMSEAIKRGKAYAKSQRQNNKTT